MFENVKEKEILEMLNTEILCKGGGGGSPGRGFQWRKNGKKTLVPGHFKG